MNKIKGFVNKNYKIVIGFILGIIVCVGIGVSAVATKEVVYDNSKSGLTSTNLQGAIDELNDKATTKIKEAEKKCPSGYRCIETNRNIVAAYTYNQTSGADNYCITGEEETCIKTRCYENSESGSCSAGTIIKYKVNDSTTKYFYVLHDDGEKMTLQQRENDISDVSWYSVYNDNSKGPLTALSKLESVTASWTNVNDQTYTMGTTNFNNTNSYTGCDSYNSCTTNTYTLDERTAKARMITLQEAAAVGCTETQKSCPIWMYNYLYNSTSYGGTNDIINYGYYGYFGYWTMNANSYCTGYDYAWSIGSSGTFKKTADSEYGARAVVVINK